ncbi:hypothetical protein N0V88_004765 [Collariella sp. IMI 366227]|nr:hypothetical protein N0V88_004765 [Collariella sp. IMI 366227]
MDSFDVYTLCSRRLRGAQRLVEGTTSVIEETPITIPDTARPLPAALKRSTTLPLPVSSVVEQSPSAASGLKKRKRQSAAKAIPEATQIFRGLSFYYIPNNDIAPARKLRIGKAQEYGARWVRNLAEATHVIVDRHLAYKDIESLLGSDAADSLVMVNEEYPIDSISFRTLLNPDQNRYRISGYPIQADRLGSEPPIPSQISDHSLQVKLPRAAREQDFKDTPPGSTEPSLQNNRKNAEGDSRDQTEGEQELPPIPLASDTHTHPNITSKPQDNPTSPHPQLRRGSNTKDELSGYIQLMQEYKHLPLDTEEDDLQSVKDAQETISDSDPEERSEEERARKRAPTRSGRLPQKSTPFADRFACNRGGTKEDLSSSAQNPNARTIEILQSMCDYYTRINDHWRTLAYRKAIATLRRQPTKINTEDEAFRLPNIGQRLAAKIEEIVCTNKLRRLEYAADEPLGQALETFLKIYDVGTSRASRWIAQGFRTLEDLRRKADLTTNQRIGIERYEDLNTRIPREEVAALFGFVQREAGRLDQRVELLLGDLDIIVTRKGTSSSAELVPFLDELVGVLTHKGFLVATLAALNSHRPGKNGPGSKWHGCCVLPNGNDGDPPQQIWRRIDFLLVPESEYGAALIYFTGNDIFNRSMRLLASKKGMRLNQRGLYKEVMRGNNMIKVTEGELLEGRDEKRIFQLLGVKWREPAERWC